MSLNWETASSTTLSMDGGWEWKQRGKVGFGRKGGKLGMEREREELNLLDNENENDIVVLNGLCLFGWFMWNRDQSSVCSD